MGKQHRMMETSLLFTTWSDGNAITLDEWGPWRTFGCTPRL